MNSHSYLSAVGFRKYKGTKEWDRLITQVMDQPTEKYIAEEDGEKIAFEYYKAYAERVGLIVRGTLDEEEKIMVNTFDPIVESKYMMDVVEVEVMEEEEDIHYAYCEEERTGTEIVFHLQNVIDYQDVEELEQTTIEGVKIVGLGIEGKIVLPVEKDEKESAIDAEEEEWYCELVKRARNGDAEAEELLDIEAEETADMIEERLQYEDFLTIVEGYFVPFEDIDTTYSLLGMVKEIEEMTNRETGEKLYWLYIDCMGMPFEVCINEKDLVGIPLIGMRFIGICWLQGQIVFS